MELHQLRYFTAVAKTGNFTRAAEASHVAQASLSQQIIKLEEELGTRLFERLRRRATLTPAGHRLLKRAEIILAEVQNAQSEISSLNAQPSGTLTLGALPTIAPYFLPTVIDQLKQAHPQIEANIQEDTTARLVEAVSKDDVELAIVSFPVVGSHLTKIELYQEPLWFAIPSTNPLATRKRATWKDLSQQRFILMQEGHCLGQQSLKFCHDQDFHPNVACRSAQIETVLALIRKNVGVSLIPDMARQSAIKDPDIAYLPLDRPCPFRSIVLIHRQNRHLSSAATATLEILKRQGKKSK